MKRLILLIVWALPAITWAQQPKPSPLKFIPFQSGMANMVGFKLAAAAVLYRHLSDTANTQPAVILQPGDAVIVWRESPHWLIVYRGKRNLMSFSSDTSLYYMPRAAIRDGDMFIML